MRSSRITADVNTLTLFCRDGAFETVIVEELQNGALDFYAMSFLSVPWENPEGLY